MTIVTLCWPYFYLAVLLDSLYIIVLSAMNIIELIVSITSPGSRVGKFMYDSATAHKHVFDTGEFLIDISTLKEDIDNSFTLQ